MDKWAHECTKKEAIFALVQGTQTGTTRNQIEPPLLLECGNDPSAGSPTETLLRLHLPLNDEV
jgi:hypothetical protein